jgi:plasmid stabilization system protein ParE
MTRLLLLPQVLEDFERFADHLALHDAAHATARLQAIVDALDVLTHSPLIGRKVEGGCRELVIGQRPSGYVALYDYSAALQTVFVIAMRAQREAGYAGDRD